jgi:hypothetical protein
LKIHVRAVVLVLLIAASPVAAIRASTSSADASVRLDTPTATLRVAVPNEGEITVAESVFELRGIDGVPVAAHPRLRLRNANELGNDDVVVASVAQEVTDRSRLDLTVAVIRRDNVPPGNGTDAIPDAVLVLDEPDLPATPTGRLLTITTIASTDVVVGHAAPSYQHDCGAGTASFLSGDHTGLSVAQSTLSYACGFALDQDWMPVSFASEIAASWCGGLFSPVTAGSSTYAVGEDCNFPINAFAVQDPKKSTGVTGLTLVPPLAGKCQAPLQAAYIGTCELAGPLAASTPDSFTMTLAQPLPSGAEFGYTALSGSIQRNFPMEEIDPLKAASILTDLKNNPKTPGTLSRSIRDTLYTLTNGDLAKTCEYVQRTYDTVDSDLRSQEDVTVAKKLLDALKALGCSPR